MNVAVPARRLVTLGRPDERFDISKASLAEWHLSDSFERMRAFYRNYPPNSLQSDEARALLHHLVMVKRPERVLEIGTWQARTTEVIARALWEAGHGHIDTIDPFGGDRCPQIIASFPAELRNLITFRAENSGTHFDRAMSANTLYDLVLVDGNHEFEFALFDLMCAARVMRPDSVMVIDNIEQVGPRLATKVFLERNPDWQDIAGVVPLIDPANPFEVPPASFPDTKFYLLKAPSSFVVRQEPRVFGPADVDRAEIDGIELELKAPAVGMLHILVFARTFGISEPEELRCQQRLAIDVSQVPGDGRLRIPLERPLRTSFPQPGLHRRVEISLAFNGHTTLGLRSPPQPYPAKYGRSIGL